MVSFLFYSFLSFLLNFQLHELGVDLFDDYEFGLFTVVIIYYLDSEIIS